MKKLPHSAFRIPLLLLIMFPLLCSAYPVFNYIPSAVVNSVSTGIYNLNPIYAAKDCQTVRITDIWADNSFESTGADVQFIIELNYFGLTPDPSNDPGWVALSPAPSGGNFIAYKYTQHLDLYQPRFYAPDFKVLPTYGNTDLPILVHSLLAGDDPATDSNTAEGDIFATYHYSLSDSVSTLPALGKPDCEPLDNINDPVYSITSDLTIDEDFCMQYKAGLYPSPYHTRATYYLFPGVQITVQNGVTLSMIEADFIGCDEMWKGIEVEEGATLIADDVKINDARYAINAKAGSTLQLTNSTLTDNYIGLNLDMNGAGSGVAHRVTLSGLADNTFTSSDNGLKTPYSGMPEAVEQRGYCGIWLNGYQDFNTWDDNNFYALANGLIATNSIMNVSAMHFDDMNSIDATHLYAREGYGMYLEAKGASTWANVNELYLPAMTFNECKTGIYATNMAGRVDNCTMTKVGTGIEWRNSKTRDVRLRQNDIFAENYGIRSFANEPVHSISIMDQNTIEIVGVTSGLHPVAGISMQEMGLGHGTGTTSPALNGWVLHDNPVTMEHSGFGIHYVNGAGGSLLLNNVTNQANAGGNPYTGIRVEGVQFSAINANNVTQETAAVGGLGGSVDMLSSGGYANGYACNTFDNSDIGLQFKDMADYTDAVRGNSFGEHSVGLQLGEDGAGNVFIGTQDHTGNTWDLGGIPSGGFGGVHWGGVGLAPYSQFYVGDLVNSTVHPPVDPVIWFTYQKGEDFSDCAPYHLATPPAQREAITPDALDDAIVGDSLPTLGFDTATIWKARYREYRKILRHSGWTGAYASYATFKTANDSLSTGRLATIAEGRSRLFRLDSLQLDTLDGYRLALEAKRDTLLQKDSLLQKGLYLPDSYYSGLVHRRETVLVQEKTYRDALAEDRLKKIDDLLDLNAAVTTGLLIERNHKTVNEIVLNLLASDTLRTNDLDTLTVIANYCPLEGGDAVYEARSIVTAYTGAGFDDSDLCADADNRDNIGKISSMQEITLYPNPAAGYVNWTGTNEPVTVRIFNTLGVLQLERKDVGNYLDISLLADGFYTLQLLKPDLTVLTTRKLLVAKR